MASINNEIYALKAKLLQLENEKKIQEEQNKKMNDTGNLKILLSSIEKRKDKVKKDTYSRSCIVAKFIDMDMIEPLEVIHNLLTNMNNKINQLEQEICDINIKDV